MTWQSWCGHKLVSAAEALDIIQPTDRVFTAGLTGTPFTLCRALVENRQRLRGLRLNTLVSLFDWNVPGLDEYFHFESWYLSRRERPLLQQGQLDYVPVSYFRAEAPPYGIATRQKPAPTRPGPDPRGSSGFSSRVAGSGGTDVSRKRGNAPSLTRRAQAVIKGVEYRPERAGED